MKAYFLPLGEGGNRGLPAILTAFSSGAARQCEAVTVLRIAEAAPQDPSDRMIADLRACHRMMTGRDAVAFFRTEWACSLWTPVLPGRDALMTGEESRLLLQALRGEGVPFSFRTDREAAEWSASALLERVREMEEEGAEASAEAGSEAGGIPAAERESLRPFTDFCARVERDLEAGEDVRVILQCDLAEGYAAGMAMALCRFLRERFSGNSPAGPAPFLGMIGQARRTGTGAGERAGEVREALAALRDRNLVRAAEDRDTLGADALWLTGLPAALTPGEEQTAILDWASARILGEVFTAEERPSAGIHTREVPVPLTLQALDREAKPAAAFLRGVFWCLSDLFPSLESWFEHPALIRSLAPATRGGLFRKLFRDAGEEGRTAAGGNRTPEDLKVLVRTMRVLALEFLSLIRTLPPLLQDAEEFGKIWDQAVRACGRTVTLASEADVRRKEAEESGLDKVAPVHRVSLSDTEEEEMIRRLEQLEAEVRQAREERGEVFRKAGGYLSRLALQDCLEKCETAEKNAREKLIRMPVESAEERYALGLQERRTRLLAAAVSRCEGDLEEARKWPALSQPGQVRSQTPFAGEILDPGMAGQAFQMLTGEKETAEEAAKAVRDGLGGLLKGYPQNDVKMLLKNLISTCRMPDAESPLRGLMAGVFSVCGVEVSGLRISSVGALPALPLLPDLTEGDRFFTLAAAPEKILAPGREDRTARDRGLLALMILREYRRRDPGDAGLEILPLRGEDSTLIRIYLASRGVEEAYLCCLRKEEGENILRQPLAVLLPEIGLEAARMRRDRMDLIPAFAFWTDRENMTFRDPCVYFSEGDRQVLTEQLTRLRAALKSPRGRKLADFLSAWHQDIMREAKDSGETEDLRRRLRIACGLSRLPMWQKELRRSVAFFEPDLPGDALCAALSGQEHFDAAKSRAREDALYVFRGTPVARESAGTLLESSHAPEEALYLGSLNTECDILFHSSDDYHEALAAGLRELMARFPAAEPEAVETAENLLKEALEPVKDQVTELEWPWDTVSASVLTILTECLGKELAAPALRAFSDRLALFPARGGEILGDALFSGLCLVPRESGTGEKKIREKEGREEGAVNGPAAAPENRPAGWPAADAPGSPEGGWPAEGMPGETAGAPAPQGGAEATETAEAAPQARPDAVLPPLSPEFARALCRSPRGQSLIQPGFLRFAAEGAGVRAEMTLEGAFTLKLIRIYAPEEISAFYAQDLPTLALWPSLPFAQEDWKAYYSYAHASEKFRFTAVCREEEIPLEGEGLRKAACHREFPLCYLVLSGEESLGAIPNLLPSPVIPEGGLWTACVDFGAAAASVIFTDGSSRWPLQGPVTVRTLMRSPAATGDLLWREFLPAVPVSALIPAALRLFRRDLTEKDQPLRDGAVFMSASLRDVLEVTPEALYTDLKWNGEKGRASRIYLHQIMLMTALQARCGGARQLNWRVSLPGEMGQEGRERLAVFFRTLAEEVSRESGIPLPEKHPPVGFASESAALGAYFRFVSPEETRGGFMALDLGADTADLSLYLQGREEAVRVAQLPLGLHNLLLPHLLRRPGMLREDFGFIAQAEFQRDLGDLQNLMERAGRDPQALRQARYGLDAFVADHFPLLLDALGQRRGAGSPGRTGALILLNDCFLMMLGGLTLLQIAGDSLRNDTLPEAMTLFLAGRGSGMMECLSMQTKASLWKMLTMFRNPKVSSMNLIFSAEKKMEIPVGLSVLPRVEAGLPKPAAVPAAMAIRPEELMPEFLLRFRREFPAEAAMLFPGVYAEDYFAPFTPFGQQLLGQALQIALDRRDAGGPYPALAACLNLMMEMIQEGLPQ